MPELKWEMWEHAVDMWQVWKTAYTAPCTYLHPHAHRYRQTHEQTHSRAVRWRLHDRVSRNRVTAGAVQMEQVTHGCSHRTISNRLTRSLSHTKMPKWALTEKQRTTNLAHFVLSVLSSLPRQPLSPLFLSLVLVFVWACPHVGCFSNRIPISIKNTISCR